MSAQKANVLYIAPGLAHGFYVRSDTIILIYKVKTIYYREHDSGILWNSVGTPWPDSEPTVSPRDAGFVAFADFFSPFRCKEEATDGC
ncbi:MULTISPECIES: dTDP-4-dehydrorhamnose 3,5-epimerase family protein [Aerosakkonema]|uniref:dTDP-4-dehydrorhamnose 3,5-epimerase family protein n=1 Tax=Aerosakkonema TaxID=1246629 RepID=UPI0035B707E0